MSYLASEDGKNSEMDKKDDTVTSSFGIKLKAICAVLGIIASIIFYFLVFSFLGREFVILFVGLILPGWESGYVVGRALYQFQWIRVFFFLSGALGGVIGGYSGYISKYQLRGVFISSTIGGIIFSLLTIIILLFVIFAAAFRS